MNSLATRFESLSPRARWWLLAAVLVALFVLIAVVTYLRPRLTGDVPSVRARIGICLCYALGLFAKEHAIVLPALLVAIELLLARDSRSPRARLALVRPLVLWLTLV